ncbi:DUF427 domain-containing protein [Wenxinia saemankumensis]|uniref:Uncharacterized conserved protein, DUF427 family n=1 Tax=Wenxinia saemankumensis TaxID=1447782 RepID=A0A1M6CIS8_9RHOB|nr:DUF427 domain-containing protein [Wenxinia saemankumensis]SHI60813.1 Uncharacterized conserved protein, DUF427 family [Wenxinia saemankumensis]
MSKIEIRPATGTYSIRAGGAVLGETSRALELVEDGHDPVIYVPREDLAMAFLDPSPTRTTCPHKGEASYFHISTGSGTIPDGGWSYETPKADVAQIAGHIAFYPDKVTVEQT